jgi:4-alpha-glucanotransferase
MTNFPRASGILMHPTSLPGRYGIGDLGEAAYRFVDRLSDAGMRFWQVLPLGPTGFADSPYQSFSSFAGNTNLVSLDDLAQEGWLNPAELEHIPYFSERRVDYAAVIRHHDELLALAYDRFIDQGTPDQRRDYAEWHQANAFWIEDFALFMALKEFYGGQPWVCWARGEVNRREETLDAARHMHACRIAEHRFRQWVFYRQWFRLKAYANQRDIEIIGDVPIYVAHDSCDVWVNRKLFELDAQGQPIYIAGVPPDLFSATGQRWGNPLYVWDVHHATGYQWWVERIQRALTLVDRVRIDHFRGFDLYYKIPASSPTAEDGDWKPGPKREFFDMLRAALGEPLNRRIIAEDLGNDLGDALTLRDHYELPGMQILQFAFSGSAAEQARFQPDQGVENAVMYTGTHDNNTLLGWWHDEASAAHHAAMRACLERMNAPRSLSALHWQMIWMGMRAHAHTFIVPMQDVLGLGASARMNRPGVPSGNWVWRATPAEMDAAPWDRLRQMVAESGRK